MTVRSLLSRASQASGAAFRLVLSRWTEILLVTSYIGGWSLITWGLARLLVDEVWLISGGLFLLAAGGLGLLKDVAVEGLYVLSRLAARKGSR